MQGYILLNCMHSRPTTTARIWSALGKVAIAMAVASVLQVAALGQQGFWKGPSGLMGKETRIVIWQMCPRAEPLCVDFFWDNERLVQRPVTLTNGVYEFTVEFDGST
jgi:hypothetical protein